MPWVTFTAADIRDGLAVREISIYEETAGQDFDGDIAEAAGERLSRNAARLVEQFRGVILANPLVPALGPTGTIPSFCVPWIIAIARFEMRAMNPTDEGGTDSRRDLYNDAIKGRDSLKTMPAAAFALEDPSSSSDSCGSSGGEPLLDF